ncbi:hypothetical protein Emag_001189 [Eimeria magna]
MIIAWRSRQQHQFLLSLLSLVSSSRLEAEVLRRLHAEQEAQQGSGKQHACSPERAARVCFLILKSLYRRRLAVGLFHLMQFSRREAEPGGLVFPGLFEDLMDERTRLAVAAMAEAKQDTLTLQRLVGAETERLRRERPSRPSNGCDPAAAAAAAAGLRRTHPAVAAAAAVAAVLHRVRLPVLLLLFSVEVGPLKPLLQTTCAATAAAAAATAAAAAATAAAAANDTHLTGPPPLRGAQQSLSGASAAATNSSSTSSSSRSWNSGSNSSRRMSSSSSSSSWKA